MISLSRRSTLLAIVAAIAAAAALAMTLGAQSAHASYKRCTLSESEQNPSGTKPTYNLSLKRIGTSCRTAKRVMRSFHSCRSRSSAKCTRRVRTHWRCSGTKTSTNSLGFYGKFTCKWGSRRVQSTYQQNL